MLHLRARYVARPGAGLKGILTAAKEGFVMQVETRIEVFGPDGKALEDKEEKCEVLVVRADSSDGRQRVLLRFRGVEIAVRAYEFLWAAKTVTGDFG